MSASTATADQSSSGLKKSFGLFALFIYGLGDILGAGIYALVGEVSLETGRSAWMSFALALAIAALTAMSYAELVVRFPKSGGVSHFAERAFSKKSVTFTVGWLLLFVSIVSMATLTRAFTGYFNALEFDLPHWLLALGFLAILGLINFRGIEQSSTANIIATSVEVLGLAIIVFCAFYFLYGSEGQAASATAAGTVGVLTVLQGAAVAFYAFIGFEDLANVAEETRDPKKHMPIAILGALFVAGCLYILIGWLATQVVDPKTLDAPSDMLIEIVRKSKVGVPVWLFSVIALFAVANTCLLNSITGSRLLFGMSKEKVVPGVFSRLFKKYQTPYIAIMFTIPTAYVLSLLGNLKFLASTASVLILLVFCSTNISLLAIKRRGEKSDGFTVPWIIPLLALAANIALMAVAQLSALLTAAAITFVGLGLYFAFFRKLSTR